MNSLAEKSAADRIVIFLFLFWADRDLDEDKKDDDNRQLAPGQYPKMTRSY